MRKHLPWVALAACLGALAWATSRPQEQVLAAYETTLNGRTRSQRHNSELAAAALNGAEIAPGAEFSFNGRVGSFSRDRGYLKAPVSYNGQLIDSWGGGVCQTSTTLYNAALLGGLEIKERNRHRFAPSYVPPGRDAAVAFDTIDLKLRNPHAFPVRVEARAVGSRLQVRLIAPEALKTKPQIVSEVRQRLEPGFFTIGEASRFGKLRNSGKAGWDVAVYRVVNGDRELISADSYPAMNRIVQTR